MIGSATRVETIAPLGHDEAMRLAATEYDKLLAVVDGLGEDSWSRPTDCADWDVTAMVGHLVGMAKLQADPDERTRQLAEAEALAAETGCLRLHAMTAAQVREHAGLAPAELRDALHATVPAAVAARRATPQAVLELPYDPGLPGESGWTVGYLYDVVLTRDPWIHRVDLSRAVGAQLDLSPDHDGRIIADVVADWSRRHGQPFTLALSGPAGGEYQAGSGGPRLELDAVEFCRVLSGRAGGSGLLATPVVF